MLKESIDLLKDLPPEDLVARINAEITQTTSPNVSKLFSLSMSLVLKMNRYFRSLDKMQDQLPGAVITLVHFLELRKRPVKLEELTQLMRNELKFNYTRTYNVEVTRDLEKATYFLGFNVIDIEYHVKRWSKYLPKRLIPILQFYINTGVIHDSMLNPLDRYYLYYVIDSLGGVVTAVDTERLEALIPNSATERLLFLAILANEYPVAFMIMAHSQSLNSFMSIIKAANGEGLPTEMEVIDIFEKVSRGSDLSGALRSRLFADDTMLTVVMSTIDWEVDTVGNAFISKVEECMAKETSIYDKTLSTLYSAANNDPSRAVSLLGVLNKEASSRSNLMSKLSK